MGQDQDLLEIAEGRCAVSDTPRTDAHTRQLIDALQHPHWIEFARELERENTELRQDGICRRRGIPTKEESKRIKELNDHIERLWKENATLRKRLETLDGYDSKQTAALRADKERLDWMSSKASNSVELRWTDDIRAAIDAARKEKP